MKAKELMIGNYVKDHLGRVQKVSETRSKAYICYLSNDHKLKYKLNTTKPIPLTEEWLVEFGFEKNCNNNYQINYNQVCGLSITILNYKSWLCNLTSTTFYELSNCKYVHQLQNLYFALTNEELTIK